MGGVAASGHLSWVVHRYPEITVGRRRVIASLGLVNTVLLKAKGG